VTEPQRGAGRPRLPWPIAAVLAVLAVTVLVIIVVGRARRPPGKTWDRPLEPVAQAHLINGSVKAVRGEERRPLVAGETVYVGEGVETESGASVSLTTYPAEAQVGLAGDGSLFFESPAEIRVQAGRVQAEIGDAAAVLVSTHARVTASKSRLSVEVGTKGTQVDVQSGDAHVEGSGREKRTVHAGARLFLSAPPPQRDR
jgi:hypothetical protein